MWWKNFCKIWFIFYKWIEAKTNKNWKQNKQIFFTNFFFCNCESLNIKDWRTTEYYIKRHEFPINNLSKIIYYLNNYNLSKRPLSPPIHIITFTCFMWNRYSLSFYCSTCMHIYTNKIISVILCIMFDHMKWHKLSNTGLLHQT